MLVALMAISNVSMGQTQKDINKERKEIAKQSEKELNAKATKAAAKEAKRLKKEGWQVAPGALPMEKQLDRSYMMQYEFDENMYPKYMMAEAMSIGENYDGAKNQAMELAKLNLAGQIQTEICALVDNSIANKQLSEEQAATVTKTVNESKSMIAQSLGRTITVMECYREKDNKNKEVLVRIAYNSQMAKEAAKEAIREELEKSGDELRDQLDDVLGF